MPYEALGLLFAAAGEGPVVRTFLSIGALLGGMREEASGSSSAGASCSGVCPASVDLLAPAGEASLTLLNGLLLAGREFYLSRCLEKRVPSPVPWKRPAATFI